MENKDSNNDKYRDRRIAIVDSFNKEMLRVQENTNFPEELKDIYVGELKKRMQQRLDTMK